MVGVDHPRQVLLGVKCRERWIDGSATFTIVASTTLISWAKHTTTRAIQRDLPLSFPHMIVIVTGMISRSMMMSRACARD
jgi:hypothetical protein